MDPMLTTVRDAPDCPMAGVNYPALKTVKSVQTFVGPAFFLGGIIRFFFPSDGRVEQARDVLLRASGDIIA
jgi:hypothetical protein